VGGLSIARPFSSRGNFKVPQTIQKDSVEAKALIAIGGNVASAWGDPKSTIQKAILKVESIFACKAETSRLYSTPAFPAGAGPDFVNAAIRVSTTYNAPCILEILHEIEAEAGRQRTVRWGQRTLDLDLIALNDLVLPSQEIHGYWRDLPVEKQAVEAPDQLILPHPRIQDRSFVLVPLADIAPDWVHPILGLTTIEMRDARPDVELASVRPI
jgi:2-amino-4-hydroxy-6-hydroxymethyldihydropteridine diphosphokinase